MKPISTLAVVALLFVLAACASFVEPSDGAGLTVEARPTHLLLTNHTAQPVYYFALERDFATLALWAPCTDPEQCPAVAPDQRAELGYGEIPGYEAGKGQTVLLYWWYLVPSSEGGFQPDSIRVIAVQP